MCVCVIILLYQTIYGVNMQSVSLQDTILYPSTIHYAVERFASFGNRTFTVVSQKDPNVVLKQGEDMDCLDELALRITQIVLFPITLVALALKWYWRSTGIENISKTDSIPLSVRLNIINLREDVKNKFEGKSSELESVTAVQEALIDIPRSQSKEFLGTIGSIYQRCIGEEKSHKEALTSALSESLAKTFISADDVADQDSNLKSYICPIAGTLVGSDAVFLREDGNHKPRERYHRESITTWINQNRSDPIDRAYRAVWDIKPDTKAEKEIETIVSSWIYSKTKDGISSFPNLLSDKSFLRSAVIAYPAAKKVYDEILLKPKGSLALAIDESRKVIENTIDLMEVFSEEVAQMTPTFLEECLKQEVTGVLEDRRTAFLNKINNMAVFLAEIDNLFLRSDTKEKTIKRVEQLIGAGVSLDEAMALLTELGEVSEITRQYPGVLFGAEEWSSLLGKVDDVPVPKGMLAILNSPCPIFPGKTVGQSHTLVLVPEKVNGYPLTFKYLKGLFNSAGTRGSVYSNYTVSLDHENEPAGPSHFVLMTKDILPGSRGKASWSQRDMVDSLNLKARATYEIPGFLDVTACLCMNYLASRTSFFNYDPDFNIRCKESNVQGDFRVTGYSPVNFHINVSCDFSDQSRRSLVVLRRF